MPEAPVFRCRCDEVLYDRDDARHHLATLGPGEHAYSAVGGCDCCDGGISPGDWVIVHQGGVYCSSECARTGEEVAVKPTPRGELSL